MIEACSSSKVFRSVRLSSEIFSNLIFSEIVWKRSCGLFGESSEIFRKWSKNFLKIVKNDVSKIKKILHGFL